LGEEFTYAADMVTFPLPAVTDENSPPPEAEPPVREPAEAVGEGRAIALDIDTGLTDMAAPETIGVAISGVPEGTSLSAGADHGGGNWSMTAADLEGLTMQLAAGSDDGFILEVAVTDGGEVVASGSLTVGVEETPLLESQPDPQPDPEAVAAAGITPVAYWKLDETSPGAVNDEMGNHPGQTSAGQDQGGGAFDAVAIFDGIDDYIEVPHAAGMILVGGTFTAWFNAFASGGGSLAAKGESSDTAGGRFSLRIKSGTLEFLMQSEDGTHVADGGSFGAEPLNTVSNASFWIAAAIGWASWRQRRTPFVFFAIVMLFVVGTCSALWHWFHTDRALLLLDSVPGLTPSLLLIH